MDADASPRRALDRGGMTIVLDIPALILFVIPAWFWPGSMSFVLYEWPDLSSLWIPAKYTLAPNSSRLMNQMRAEILREGRRGNDGH